MKNRSLQVGITGGIGAGKSIICRVFEVLGIPVYDADTRAKALMKTDRALISSIREAFGEEAYLGEEVNRTHLAKVAFERPEMLERLNALVHPRVGADYERWVGENTDAAYTLKEAALLFETGSYKQLDVVIYVSAPEGVRIDRVLKRDSHRTEADVRKIMARQWSDAKKLKLADVHINNDGSELVVPQVLAVHHQLLKQSGR